MAVTFSTTLRQAGTKNATGFQVPPEAVAELSDQKAPLVKITVNGYKYRGKIAVYGGVFLVGFSAEHRAASGINAGEGIQVTLELDTEVRTVEIPGDLRAALQNAGVRKVFDRSAPSRQKEFVRQVNESKVLETRARRIAKIVGELS